MNTSQHECSHLTSSPRTVLACALAAVSLLAPLSGCAGTPGAFSSRFPDNRADDMRTLLARVDGAPAPAPLPIAVGVTNAPAKLYAYEIPTRKVLWQQPFSAAVSPMLTDDGVVTQEGADIVVRDLRSGKRRLVIEAGDGQLSGAAGTRAATAVAITRGQGTYARSRLLLAVDGTVRWEHEVPGQAGVPAVVGSTVLLPWNHQFLSALDAKSGEEIARVRVNDGVIGQALHEGAGVFVGSGQQLTRVDAAFVAGRFKTDARLSAPERSLPGRPTLLRDVYDPHAMPPADSARHSIRLEFRAQAKGDREAAFVDDVLYLVFYRFVFAFETGDLRLRWVHTRESDVVGAGARAGGLLVAERDGRVALLSAQSGRPIWEDEGLPPSSAVFVPRTQDSVGGSDDTGAPDAEAIRTQLLLAAADTDARLVPVRLLAVELLGRSDDADATSDLLQLCDDRNTVPAVRKAACEALQSRKNGQGYVLEALRRHYSFLDDRDAPPVGALAKAVAAMGAKEAAPLLTAQLQDPNTPSEDLKLLVKAQEDLGDPAAGPPLAQFLLLYHADILDPQLSVALEMIPHTLTVLMGQEATPTLQAIVDDELSAVGVRAKARDALHRLEEAAAMQAEEEARKAAEAAAPETEAPEPETEPEPEPTTPERITSAVLESLLLPHRDALQACLVAKGGAHVQARLVVVVEDGTLMMVSVLPKELSACIEPIIRSIQFPTTSLSRRDHINYTLKRK